jgi:hypothetical protein
LFGCIYIHHLADVTLSGDYEQLKWIRDGRNGTGEGLRIFNTYSSATINKLELNLRVETTNMWSIKISSEIIAALSVICLTMITIFTFVSKNRRSAFFTLQKNTGFTWMLFSLLIITLTYLIAYTFNNADLLSHEGQQRSFNISAVVFFISPILLSISVYFNRIALKSEIQTTKWRFYLSLFFLILSLSAVLIMGMAFLLTPDLSGNIS